MLPLIIDFMYQKKRLPLLTGDFLEIKDENGEISTISGMSAIKQQFEDKETFIEYLWESKTITDSILSEILNIDEKEIKSIVKDKKILPKTDMIRARRALDMFFDEDFITDKSLNGAERCLGCTRRCKQPYFTVVVGCPNYKQKEKTK